VIALERAVLEAPPLEGVVLRHGGVYGPGANDEPGGSPGLHVDAAANAALLAIERGAPGAYNIAEPGPLVSIEKAQRELGWDPGFRAVRELATSRSEPRTWARRTRRARARRSTRTAV
jgi:hypothetical protein